MYLKVLNLSGAEVVLPGVGTFKSHSSPQYVQDLVSGFFSTREGGVNAAEVLRAAKAAGTIDYQFVGDAFDVGKLFVKSLRVSYARGSFTEAATSQVFTDDEALPAGAMLMQAHLDVHTIVSGGAVSAAITKSGHDSDDDAFDASENIFAGATRRQLTTLAVGSDIGGKKLALTFATTDGNVSALTAGDVELVVLYAIVPTL